MVNHKNKIIALAQRQKKRNDAIRKQASFIRVVGTLTEVGLLMKLGHNKFEVRALWIREILEASKAEPRILEVLPAFVYHYRALIKDEKIPYSIHKFFQEKLYFFYELPSVDCWRWVDSHKPRSAARLRVNLANAPQMSLDIRHLRMKLGLSQRQFSRACDIPFSSLEKVEKGNLNVRGSALLSLQNILNRQLQHQAIHQVILSANLES